MELSARRTFDFSEMFINFWRVFVLNCLYGKVYFLIKTVPVVILVVFRDRVVYLYAKSDSRFVGPATRDIFDCVASSTHHNRG